MRCRWRQLEVVVVAAVFCAADVGLVTANAISDGGTYDAYYAEDKDGCTHLVSNRTSELEAAVASTSEEGSGRPAYGEPSCSEACGSCDPCGAACCDPCGASCCGSGCGLNCCGACDVCCGSCMLGRNRCGDLVCKRRLLGLIAPSDPYFCNFVSPISNPLFFEDPRTLTEIKPIFIEHHFPRNLPVLQGGDAQVYAVQMRAALTRRLSFIATKDGWIDLRTPGLGHQDGFADLSAGLKYNLIRNPEFPFLLSAGFTYEVPIGQREVLQNLGDGETHMFLSSAMQLGQELYWMSGTGFRVPINHTDSSTMWYWSNSLAYRFGPGSTPCTGWYGMWETNWFTWTRSGQSLPLNFEGTDLINLGSNNVAGNDIVTMLWGLKYKPTALQEIGSGIEIPVTDRSDLFGHRVYLHWIIRH